jgi:hypothetical protein
MPYFFPKSYRRGKLCFQITFLFSYSSNNTICNVVSFRFVWFRFVSFRSVSFRFVSISFRTLQVPIDNARFYCFVRINIQGRVCLNVTIRDCNDVTFRFVSFRFVRFRSVLFDFVSLRSVSFRFVLFLFRSLLLLCADKHSRSGVFECYYSWLLKIKKKCLNGSQIGQIETKLYCWRSTYCFVLDDSTIIFFS